MQANTLPQKQEPTPVEAKQPGPKASTTEANTVVPAPAPVLDGVIEVTDRTGFVALEREWDELVTATDDQIFYRHAFLRVWLDNFAAKDAWRILTLRQTGKLVAVLPLVERKTRLYGVPVRELSAAANSHSCRFDLVAVDAKLAAAAFVTHLQADKSWDLLRLVDVPQGGKGFTLFAETEARGLPAGTWESLQSPTIPLSCSWDELQGKLQTKFKANCRRRRKKLEEKGAVTTECYRGGPELDEKLEEGFALEASGWKGERGTGMGQSKETRGFYTELARQAAYAGTLRLFFMRLDGRAVAFHFALEHGGRYLLLKPGYDEALKECSPGQLLMEEALKDCTGRGLREFDFLGPDMTWKRDWTDQVRTHTWMFIFRATSFGRALCKAKFQWGPKVKASMKDAQAQVNEQVIQVKERVARWK